jgi:hypothetical protein
MNFVTKLTRATFLALAAAAVIASGNLLTIASKNVINAQLFGPDMIQHNGDLKPFNYKENAIGRDMNKLSPIIRMHMKEEGRYQFICSAFVVSDSYAITAGHCIVNESFFMKKDDVHIFDIKGNDAKMTAFPAAVNLRVDYGLLKGDFRKFNKILLDNPPMTGFIYKAGPFASFGFPWGGALMITPLQVMPNINKAFEIQVLGPIYPGMSGGPVIDVTTGIAVGINHAVDGQAGSLIAPLVNFFDALEIDTINK